MSKTKLISFDSDNLSRRQPLYTHITEWTCIDKATLGNHIIFFNLFYDGDVFYKSRRV